MGLDAQQRTALGHALRGITPPIDEPTQQSVIEAIDVVVNAIHTNGRGVPVSQGSICIQPSLRHEQELFKTLADILCVDGSPGWSKNTSQGYTRYTWRGKMCLSECTFKIFRETDSDDNWGLMITDTSRRDGVEALTEIQLLRLYTALNRRTYYGGVNSTYPRSKFNVIRALDRVIAESPSQGTLSLDDSHIKDSGRRGGSRERDKLFKEMANAISQGDVQEWSQEASGEPTEHYQYAMDMTYAWRAPSLGKTFRFFTESPEASPGYLRHIFWNLRVGETPHHAYTLVPRRVDEPKPRAHDLVPYKGPRTPITQANESGVGLDWEQQEDVCTALRTYTTLATDERRRLVAESLDRILSWDHCERHVEGYIDLDDACVAHHADLFNELARIICEEEHVDTLRRNDVFNVDHPVEFRWESCLSVKSFCFFKYMHHRGARWHFSVDSIAPHTAPPRDLPMHSRQRVDGIDNMLVDLMTGVPDERVRLNKVKIMAAISQTIVKDSSAPRVERTVTLRDCPVPCMMHYPDDILRIMATRLCGDDVYRWAKCTAGVPGKPTAVRCSWESYKGGDKMITMCIERREELEGSPAETRWTIRVARVLPDDASPLEPPPDARAEPVVPSLIHRGELAAAMDQFTTLAHDPAALDAVATAVDLVMYDYLHHDKEEADGDIPLEDDQVTDPSQFFKLFAYAICTDVFGWSEHHKWRAQGRSHKVKWTSCGLPRICEFVISKEPGRPWNLHVSWIPTPPGPSEADSYSQPVPRVHHVQDVHHAVYDTYLNDTNLKWNEFDFDASA